MTNLTPARAVAKARVQLLLHEPFWGHLAMALDIREDKTILTTATDGRKLYFNPEFIARLTDEEVKGIVAHEVGHCAFGHIWRRGARTPMRWNVACVVGDTRITMADGTEKPVRDMRVGDWVLGYSEKGFVPAQVTLRFSKMADRMVEVRSQSDILECTDDHRLLTAKGYIQAGYCEGQALYTLDSARRWVSGRQSIHYGDRGAGRRIGSKLSSGRNSAQADRSVQPAKDGQKTIVPRFADPNPSRMELFGRNCGWRGHYSDQPALEYPAPAPLLYIGDTDCEHQLCSVSTAKGLGIHRNDSQEHEWRQVLALADSRLGLFGCLDQAGTVFGHQEAPCSSAKGVHKASAEPTVSRSTVWAHAPDFSRAQDPEQKRVSIRGRNETRRVYDIGTTTHNYIANGFIVHNCDFALNGQLKQDGLELPKGTLYSKEWADLSAEEIYAKLPEEPKQQAWCEKGDWGKEGQDGEDKDGGGGDKEGKGDDKPKNGEQYWREKVAQAATLAKMQGKLPGGLEHLVDDLLNPKVNWRELLRDMVQSTTKTDYRLMPPNKRHLWRGLYMPSLYGETIEIAVAIDTSGSIGDDLLKAFVSEVRGIAEQFQSYTVHLYACDAAVHQYTRVEDEEQWPKSFPGRGGTNFRPVFDHIRENNLAPSVLVYFTDLYGTFPDEAPEYPVIWMLKEQPKGRYEPPFGDCIVID